MDTKKKGERKHKTILHNSLFLCLSLKSYNFPIPFLFIFFSFISSHLEPCASGQKELGGEGEKFYVRLCV